jgi:NACalpha-BTF3-like transcription factor
MTNNITRYLNKIVLTFTKDNEEAYQYPDEIVTKSGKSFPTLQKLIKYYTKEERKRQNQLRNEQYLTPEYKEKQKQKYEQQEANEKKKLIDDIENGKREQDINAVMTNVPNDISRAKIIEMLIENDGDIVYTIVELKG